jgi:hypothetical protein
MTATLTPNRDVPLSALWWLFEGATIIAGLADASAADPPLPLDGPLMQWFSPDVYYLDEEYDIFIEADAVDYDSTDDNKAILPQLSLTLDYETSVTYTDVLVVCIPAIDPGSSAPLHVALPLVGVIHETTPVTLDSTETKTYKVDLFSKWFEAT